MKKNNFGKAFSSGESLDQNDAKHFGCIPMDISTDDDSEESKKIRLCSRIHNGEQSELRVRKILKAPRRLKKWKCGPCKTMNEDNAFCKICKKEKPKMIDFEIET